MSKERPILFNGPMVRAILEGRKTVTRRIVTEEKMVGAECPYGKAGDILWVRETFALHPDGEGWIYRATDPGWDAECTGVKWKPSIFMPKGACRIRLRVTDVTARWLTQLSPVQAKAEGVDEATCPVMQLGDDVSIPVDGDCEAKLLRH